MPERPSPLVFLALPPAAEPVPGSYGAALESGRALLAADLASRMARMGATVLPLSPVGLASADPFHWGRWFGDGAGITLDRSVQDGRRVEAIGYATAGSLVLLPDDGVQELLSPAAGEVVANNRFSADAFVVAPAGSGRAAAASGARALTLEAAVERLSTCPSDNAAVRWLETAGFASRDLQAWSWARFDVDTPLDLALLRVAARLPGARLLSPQLAAFLEMAALPGGRSLEVPNLARIGEVMRDRLGQLVVAGRVPAAVLRELETETACRVRAYVEERGMRSARDAPPRSLLARWLKEHGAASLVGELSTLGDAVILDTRVLMAARGGSADAARWPDSEERFASDFGDAGRLRTPWLRELVEAASAAPVPFLLGGHTLVSDGVRILVAAAWLGR